MWKLHFLGLMGSADAIKLRWGHIALFWTLSGMTGTFVRREKLGYTETQNWKKPCDDICRHWSETTITSKNHKHYWEAIENRRHGMDSPLQPLEGANPIHTLMSKPSLQNKFLLSHLVCGNMLQQTENRIQMHSD